MVVQLLLLILCSIQLKPSRILSLPSLLMGPDPTANPLGLKAMCQFVGPQLDSCNCQQSHGTMILASWQCSFLTILLPVTNAVNSILVCFNDYLQASWSVINVLKKKKKNLSQPFFEKSGLYEAYVLVQNITLGSLNQSLTCGVYLNTSIVGQWELGEEVLGFVRRFLISYKDALEVGQNICVPYLQ